LRLASGQLFVQTQAFVQALISGLGKINFTEALDEKNAGAVRLEPSRRFKFNDPALKWFL
jgi:hypothetical protein